MKEEPAVQQELMWPICRTRAALTRKRRRCGAADRLYIQSLHAKGLGWMAK